MRKIASNYHPQVFFICTLKNITWRTYLISSTVQYFFSISFCLYRACFTHLISSNLSCNLCLWYYDQLVNFDKEVNANVMIVIVSGSIISASTVHLNGIWHLIWHYISKPVLGRHPVLSGHYSIPQGCPLKTGFTVCLGRVHKLSIPHFCIIFCARFAHALHQFQKFDH